MAYRMQYCPECGKQTKHEYKRMSFLLFFILLIIGVIPGLVYLWWAWRRGDRTSVCTVDHAAMRREQRRQDMQDMAAAVAIAQQATQQKPPA